MKRISLTDFKAEIKQMKAPEIKQGHSMEITANGETIAVFISGPCEGMAEHIKAMAGLVDSNKVFSLKPQKENEGCLSMSTSVPDAD